MELAINPAAPGDEPEVALSSAQAATTLAAPTPAAMTLYVCTTCRGAGYDADRAAGRPCAGARLHAALAETAVDPVVRIVGVECLSVCKRVCAVAFAAPGKWTYVFGDLPAEEAAAVLLAGARLYAEAPDGVIPWKLRPDALKKGAVSRVPALPFP